MKVLLDASRKAGHGRWWSLHLTHPGRCWGGQRGARQKLWETAMLGASCLQFVLPESLETCWCSGSLKHLSSFHKEGTRKGLGFRFFVALFLDFHHKPLFLDTRNLAGHRHQKPAISRYQQPCLGKVRLHLSWSIFLVRSLFGAQSLNSLTLFREGERSATASKLAGWYMPVLEEAVGKRWKNPSAFLSLR